MTQELPAELKRALATVARVPRVLIACDYDGTMAPIVTNPDDARPLTESAAAMRELAALPSTIAALISGRALRDLATLSRMPAEVHLVGSHGSEFDTGFVHAIDDDAKALLRKIKDALGAIAAEYPGVAIEIKPASIALHVRNADPADADEALKKAHAAAQSWDAQITEGKAVLEFAVIQTDKGQALDILRHQQGASAAVFFGDDVTDEKAFRRLHGPDVGVKVGDGDTLADYRVESPEDVALALNFLLECRRTWLLGGHSTPIERLTMLSNGRTVALLTPEADAVWMCHPQADSAAVFSRLLGDANAGHFAIGPEREALPLSQRYVDGTMTVETRWASLLVTDYLSHDVGAGRTDLVRVISGQAKAVVSFAPRPEFAQAPVHLRADDGGLRVFATNEPMVLRAPGVDWEIVADGVHETARAVVDPSQGPVVLELRCGTEDLVREPGRRGFTSRARRELLAGLGGDADAARAEPVADEAVGADAARARARRHRRDHGRGDHVAARGDRRRPQLGLPLLLDPRRRDDRGLAGVVGLHRRGRGISELAARCDRDDARARAAASALRAVRRDPRPGGGHRLAARLCGLAPGAGRQRRECPSAAGCFRPRGAADLRPGAQARRATGGPTRSPTPTGTWSARWCSPSRVVGPNRITASGRSAARRGTTCTRR